MLRRHHQSQAEPRYFLCPAAYALWTYHDEPALPLCRRASSGIRQARRAPKPSYSQQPTRQYGSFGRVSIYGDEYNDFSQIPTRPKPQKDYSVHTQPKPAPKVSFAAGEMVQHKAFGRGMILTVLPMGADALLEIAFDGVGTKRLMANTASQHMKKL